ncbi:transposase domain containing protein [Trichonephila clavipes]|nr:transposase domain containing protein [Trichonephila clavipes]
MFQQDNAPNHKATIALECFQEHDAEFQLMSWSSNSPDLNPTEHIWDVMGQQLRVERPPIHNISDLRDRWLYIWHNLSPTIYQGLVVSMPRWVEAVLRAKVFPLCEKYLLPDDRENHFDEDLQNMFFQIVINFGQNKSLRRPPDSPERLGNGLSGTGGLLRLGVSLFS